MLLHAVDEPPRVQTGGGAVVVVVDVVDVVGGATVVVVTRPLTAGTHISLGALTFSRVRFAELIGNQRVGDCRLRALHLVADVVVRGQVRSRTR